MVACRGRFHAASRFTLSASPVLAIDLGGTQVRAAIVLPDGTCNQRVAAPTPVAAGALAAVEAMAAAARAARDAAPRDIRDRLRAIAVAAPGPLDPWRGVLVSPPNLGPPFFGFAIADALADALGLPVFLERDTNVAALAEHAFGAARGIDDFLYVTVSTGFGGAIVSRGALVQGPDGMAGELGHLQVSLDGPECLCGGIGHVEAICSGGALARAAGDAVEAARSPFLADRARRNDGRLHAHDVAEGEDVGDATSTALMERARAAFAAAMVGAVNALNPSLIVVGGSIAEAQGDRLFEPARGAVARGAFPVPGKRVRIVAAELGADVALAGAQPLIAARFDDPAYRRPHRTSSAPASPEPAAAPH